MIGFLVCSMPMTPKKKIAILTSGGDAPGMNAAIRAMVRTGIHLGYEMYGIRGGFQGLIWGNKLYYDQNHNFYEKEGDVFFCIDYERNRILSKNKKKAIALYNQEKKYFKYNNLFTQKGKFLCLNPKAIIELTSNKYILPLTHQDVDGIVGDGGTILGTSRCPEFIQKPYQKKAEKVLQELEIENVVVIGGNGSILGAQALSQYKTIHGTPLNVIAVPGSIDNDIGCTSISIGTYTAVNTITEACYRISSTASSHKRVFIIDVMGRECGYLALSSFVASGADYILFRESGVSQKEELKTLIKKIKYDFSLSRQKHRFIIIKSENYPLESDKLKKNLDHAFKNTPQKIGVRITNLGHVVRGGPSTSFDRLLASRLGAASIYAFKDKKTKCLVGWIGYGHYETSSFDHGVGIWNLDHIIQETERMRKLKSPYIRNRNKAYHELGKLLCQ